MSRKAGILARYSTDNQEADSIEVQVEKCQKYANDNNIDVVDIYADFAVSGMKKTRPQYERMMADIKAGRIDTVIIYDQSRMFRDMVAWFQFREELTALGAEVISVTQPMIGGDLKDPTVFLTEATMAMFNQMWVLQTRQKTVAKLRYMASQGLHTGGMPPLGYSVVDKHFVINEKEAAVIRRIFSEYANGKSYKQIIDSLNADGVKTRGGKSFGSNSLHDLMRNEKYIGVLTFGAKAYNEDGKRNTHAPKADDIIRLEGAIPAIIDMETWERVQKMMDFHRQNKTGRPPINSYPLKGKVFCGDCGCAMIISTSKQKYNYYKCNGKKRTHECTMRPIRADLLDKTVATHIRSLMGNPDIKQKAIDILRREADNIIRQSASRLYALQEELWSIKTRSTRIVSAIADGVDTQQMRDTLKALEVKRIETEAKCDQLKASVETSRLPIEKLENLFDAIMSKMDGDLEAILSIVYRVEVFENELKIYTIFDPDPEKKKFDRDMWDEDTGVTISSDETSGVPRIVVTNLGILMCVAR